MCGITGVVNFGNRADTPSVSLIKNMVATLKHRGPDEFGMYRDNWAGLGHARLSIIDLQLGQQPLCNETKKLWISFNGEIFNYTELREELLQKGHKFRTHSDTEVIVHAFEEWGGDCFERFNGQWAIALWDAEKRELVLSRDRMGIRPLYIHTKNSRLSFASEVKALFANPDIRRALNAQGLAQTFSYWGPVAPLTVFDGIEEILPATARTYKSDGSFKDHIFWSPSFPETKHGNIVQPKSTPISDVSRHSNAKTERRSDTQRAGIQNKDSFPLSLDEATETLKEKLTEATRIRALRSDVPVGSYLSGGLDSSITAWMGRQAKSGDFRTFSLRFKDAEFDETSYQRQMADRIDSHHEEVVVSREDIAEIFPTVIYHTERPVLRTAPAPMFMLSKLVQESGIKSVITGEGADEVLAGYDIFREAKIRRFWAQHPDSTRRPLLFDRLYPYLARAPQQAKGMAQAFWKQGLPDANNPGFSHGPRWKTTSTIQKFFNAEIRAGLSVTPAPNILASLPVDFSNWTKLGQDQYIEILTLFGPYLISSQGDRMLMANSVEGRFPFLDVHVMDFCNSLPPSYKLHVLDEKHILKRVAKDIVAPDILTRKKQPYRAPDAISFVSSTAPDYVAEMLSPEAVTSTGVFDPRKVQMLYAKLRKSVAADGQVIFSNADNMAFIGILSTQLLANQFIHTPPIRETTSITFATNIDHTS